jgi:hypothetical protein
VNRLGYHVVPEAVLVSVEQYEALLEASERQRAVAAALASVGAEGLEPSAALQGPSCDDST